MYIEHNKELLSKLKPTLDKIEDKDELIVRLVEDMLLVWKQYNTLWGRGDPCDMLTHACMTAGESAAEVLEILGIADDGGYCITLSPEYKFILED
jgi:hypothetical protein